LFKSDDKGQTWERMPRPVRYEESKGVRYIGHWRIEQNHRYSAGGANVSDSPGATASFNFDGVRIRWIGSRGPDHGIARIGIDEHDPVTVDLYAVRRQDQCCLYESRLLEPGLHSATVTVAGQRHADASGSFVYIDAFDVEPPTVRTRS